MVLLGSALLILLGDSGISSDELSCELAVAHILSCCPEITAVPVRCVRSGCDGPLAPGLDNDQATCLRALGCEALRGLGVCDLATWRTPEACATPCETKVPRCE